ncbi:hypothetical protein LX87_02022 [Larkinella arboricola]|uniref:Uncharacterized protein n=1 Tax=Larkinella arboricola TaxID=643671 RepID=A0A327X2G7_LARAB|nr:hypothetical protein [Larkinella arboricola]RAK00320.1 hypothetical protein LX87_02022 [Larkinella arboricola]
MILETDGQAVFIPNPSALEMIAWGKRASSCGKTESSLIKKRKRRYLAGNGSSSVCEKM